MVTLENIDITKTKVAKSKPFRSNPKRSLRAKQVAYDVIENVGNRGGKSLGEIVKANGYADSIVKNPQKVTDTWSYKEAMATYESKLVKLRDKTLEALASKDLPKEKTFDLTGLFKVTDHSTALVQGKATENIATKGDIVVFNSDDFLARQLNNGSTKP